MDADGFVAVTSRKERAPKTCKRGSLDGPRKNSVSYGESSLVLDTHRSDVDLALFKTKPCTKQVQHDFRCCPDYHKNDRRRNPYLEIYFPEDSDVTPIEKVYHPMLFRTKICPASGSAAAASNRGHCNYGKYCAFAHSSELLRDGAELVYPPPRKEAMRKVELSTFVVSALKKEKEKTTGALGRQATPSRTISAIPSSCWTSREGAAAADAVKMFRQEKEILTAPQIFLLENAFKGGRTACETMLVEQALQYACQLSVEQDRVGRRVLTVLGANAVECVKHIVETVFAVPTIAEVECYSDSTKPMVAAPESLGNKGAGVWGSARREAELKPLGERVVLRFQAPAILQRVRKDLKRMPLSNMRFWHQRDGDAKAREYTIFTDLFGSGGDEDTHTAEVYEPSASSSSARGQKGCSMARDFATIVANHIRQNRYEPADCMICCDVLLKHHDGVCCPSGHFVCTAHGCFDGLVESQSTQRVSQNGELRCPGCQKPFDNQHLAKRVPKVAFEAHVGAIVEARVIKESEALSRKFDERLAEKVAELADQYAENPDQRVKLVAQQKANEARNNALDLRCPHCRMVYIDFTGCVALQCEGCRGHFCGFCHKACKDSRGAHDHVRECPFNTTDNSSYYASEVEIKHAQRRFRIKRMKEFLAPLRKEIQNATVLELTKDLNDVNIDPAALLDFGNMQAELDAYN